MTPEEAVAKISEMLDIKTEHKAGFIHDTLLSLEADVRKAEETKWRDTVIKAREARDVADLQNEAMRKALYSVRDQLSLMMTPGVAIAKVTVSGCIDDIDEILKAKPTEKPVDNTLMMTCGYCGEEHHRTFMPHHKLNCPQKRKDEGCICPAVNGEIHTPACPANKYTRR